MPRKIPIFYSALMLTGVNLLLRFAGTSFQVYITGQIGAEGVGLLQLVLSVGMLAMTVGIGGIRTATMYLTAEELGKRRPGNVRWVLSGCFLYSILFSGTTSLLLYFFAPQIANNWLGQPDAADAIRLLAGFLPVSCLCGVMTGYFTAANRIGTLAAVEVAEQACSMAITLLLLSGWAEGDAHRACKSVVLGSGIGSCLTLVCLLLLQQSSVQKSGLRIPIARRLTQAAVPLALADNLKAGLSTAENLMVPKRLALFPGTDNPLALFGVVCGMVFPVLMFPACILFGLAELLIPELARCNAAESNRRIRYLVRRSLRVSMLYGLAFGGLMFLTAQPLCMALYKNREAGNLLRLYSALLPMLYCDAITDAINKGLGQQKISVRFNILTAAMDVALLFALLPRYGLWGYFFSFTLTHAVNFLLSIGLLQKTTGVRVKWQLPVISLALGTAAVLLASRLPGAFLQCVGYLGALFALLSLSGILSREDIRWVFGLLRGDGVKKV